MRFAYTRPALGTVAGLSMLLITATPSASQTFAGSVRPASSSMMLPSDAAPSTTPKPGSVDAPRVHRWIPLITGDRIAIDGRGAFLSARPAKGREDIPILVRTLGGHTYAVPDDARALIESGRLDRRLFDITTLSAPAYERDPGPRLIVMYSGARPAARTALRTTAGADIHRTLPSINADAITTTANGTATLWSAITQESAHAGNRAVAPGIASVWLDAVVHATLDKSVPQIGGPEAWAAGFDGTGSRIAVLDSGIDTTHPDLAQQVVAEHNFSDSPTVGDLFGHGTHVASIAAGTGAKSGGKYKGVAPGARILNDKVLNDSGSGSMSQIIAGMEWAVSEKADVANLSLGAYDSEGTDPMEEAVDTLSAESGTLFVVAAGNSGEQGSGTINTPGSADAALTVGAVDKQDALASFSSTGPRAGDGGIKPDVTAPGVSIGAAAAHDSQMAHQGAPVAEGYVALSGTSMATPHVSGAAAILAQQHPDWSGDDIKQALVASTTPGPYTAFQQGSGRIDLRKAIKATVFTRETALSFGLAQWPHTDDQPLTKNLTYRNVGDRPVTLKLAVNATAPDGSPAPAGMFTTDDHVTVPAHGEATVKAVADTRLGGDTAGHFTARITATGDGQTVGTALAVERESEMYTVTVKAVDRTGKPAVAGSWDGALIGLTGPRKQLWTSLSADTASVRVPKGKYFLAGTHRSDPTGSNTDSMDWFNAPNLNVAKNTTVTLDARTAAPVDVTVPNRAAHQTFGTVAADINLPDGSTFRNLVAVHSFKDLRIAHVGPKAAPEDQLWQRIVADFTTGVRGHDDYELIYTPKGDRYVTGFSAHSRSGEFADVRTDMGAPAKGKTGYISTATNAGGGLSVERPLPSHATLHLLSEDTGWWMTAYQLNSKGAAEASYGTPLQTFKPGRSYHHVFNVGVFGPDLPQGARLFRNGNVMDGSLPLFSDGIGNVSDNNEPVESASTQLYRNGELVRSTPFPMDFFYVADEERADYRLVTSVVRGSVADVSTSLTAEWTFSSANSQGDTTLPVSVVRFTPKLAMDSTGRARATTWVPFSVKGSAQGRNLKSLSVWVSYNKGTTWQKTWIRHGRALVTNPKAGGSVSFKAKAVDRQGNSVTETLLDAYLTK
ncbi:S8 family peptidase [Streptomyces sp. NPDC001185]|uniref:S8 family peptidase n=1 Tax=Streptomyces sp. NPDC001185 TaxID=3154380 RepID=UPI0033299564